MCIRDSVKIINIEALTMLDMVQKDILPAVSSYVHELSDTVLAKKAVSAAIPCDVETTLINKLSGLASSLYTKAEELNDILLKSKDMEDVEALAHYFRDSVFAAMQELRAVADEIEVNMAKEFWPYPTYGELLFNV